MEGGLETSKWDRPGSGLRLVLSLLVGVPAFVLAILIHVYGFNLPNWDGWEEYDLFNRLHQHSLTFDDLIAQHNEHRIFFPRLLLLGAFEFEPYTDIVEFWVIWLLACLSSLCLWRLSRYTGLATAGDFLLLAGANVMLFNWLAWEDWLWGFQIGFLLPILCVTAGVWLVSVSRGYGAFLWAFFWAAVNTFTVASGFLTWIVLFPLLLFPGGKFSFRWKGLLFYLLGLGASLFFYFHGYIQPGGGTVMPFTASALPNALIYFLTYLGTPLADQSGMIVCIVMGSFLVIMYLICLVSAFLRRHEPAVLSRALPWLTFCHFAIGCAAITTIGRMGIGVDQALTSRYIVFSSLLPIGLLFAGAYLLPGLIGQMNWRSIRQLGPYLLGALPIICFAVYLWNAVASISVWDQCYHDRLRAKAALVFINTPASAPLLEKLTYPNIEMLKSFLDLRAEYGPPQETLADSDITSLEDTSPLDPKVGQVTKINRSASGTTLSGWAYLPKAGRVTDLVLVTVSDPSHHDRLIKVAVVETPDEVAASKANCPGDTLLGWTADLPPETDLGGLKVWSFDGLEERAYQIPESRQTR